jgi:methionyl-tRNA formyltransferase
MKLVITAGFDGSIPAIAMCELLRRSGHCIDTVLVVTPFSVKRLKTMVRQRGIQGLKKVAGKLLPSRKSGVELNLQAQFLLDNGIPFASLKAWCKANEVSYVLVENLNSSESIQCLKRSAPDAVIYAGGGILKSRFIKAANQKIVNNHSGPLPAVRGMNAVEWSILLGHEPSITIHMIDQGIDTGEIISRKKLTIGKGETIETIRDNAVISGVVEVARLFSGLTDLNNLKKETNRGNLAGRQCYILAPAVRELLIEKLKGRLNV